MSDSAKGSTVFTQAIAEHMNVIQALHAQQPVLEEIAKIMTRAIQSGKKVLWCGNGGSAADSQHLAAEFVGRFRRQRRGFASIALTTDTSILTSVANDYGFEDIFRRQVEALCQPGDVVVGISTSGNSRNVCAALRAAADLGAVAIAFTGAGGGAIAALAAITLCIASQDTARIQEGHILCGHMLCDWVEASMCESERAEGKVSPR